MADVTREEAEKMLFAFQSAAIDAYDGPHSRAVDREHLREQLINIITSSQSHGAGMPMNRAIDLVTDLKFYAKQSVSCSPDNRTEWEDRASKAAGALIAALTRPAPQPSPSDAGAVDALIDASQLYYEAAPGSASVTALNALDKAKHAVLARMRGAAVPQPISTATKDGSTILVYFKQHGWMTVSWTSDEGPESKWAHWHIDDHKHGPYPVRGYIAGDDTHWMPLPAAPEVPR